VVVSEVSPDSMDPPTQTVAASLGTTIPPEPSDVECTLRILRSRRITADAQQKLDPPEFLGPNPQHKADNAKELWKRRACKACFSCSLDHCRWPLPQPWVDGRDWAHRSWFTSAWGTRSASLCRSLLWTWTWATTSSWAGTGYPVTTYSISSRRTGGGPEADDCLPRDGLAGPGGWHCPSLAWLVAPSANRPR
jgi:hypothetical protein